MKMIDQMRRLWKRLLNRPDSPELLMYRVHLFNELLSITGNDYFTGKRILEIGPKDGLDSKRLASLQPAELVMFDLPEKDGAIKEWLPEITGRNRYIVGNFMYITPAELADLGRFDLIWCTGVLYHNPEQLRFLRKLYKLLNIRGYLVLESATLRQAKALRRGNYVEIHYPDTYRDTGTITHLPSAGAIKSWLKMVGFLEIADSRCFDKENKNLIGQRYACLCKKNAEDEADIYYGKSNLNPKYRFGDST
jgi:SAM-dependent methyltransferase